jgi:putative Mg2+ transporter-C (MgtC) family protein
MDFALKMAIAVVLGGMIGFQRERLHKPAGLRTHILIVFGAVAVMETSRYTAQILGGDPTRIASNVIVGIGFLGAGAILKEGPIVHGLTTAATIWVAGALGLLIGVGFFGGAVLLTVSTLVILQVFGRIEYLAARRRVIRRYQVFTEDVEPVVARIRNALEHSQQKLSGLDFRREAGHAIWTFEFGDTPAHHDALFNDLRALKEVTEVRSM